MVDNDASSVLKSRIVEFIINFLNFFMGMCFRINSWCSPVGLPVVSAVFLFVDPILIVRAHNVICK